MGELKPSLARRVLPFVVGAAFFVAVAIATWRMATLREVAIAQERERTFQLVDGDATEWETELIQMLTDHIEAPPTSQSQAERRQRRLRKSRLWFDSIYVWRTDQKSESVFPARPSPDRSHELAGAPCVRRANRLFRALGPVPPDYGPVADAFVLGCRSASLLVRLYAATEAAYFLQDAHPTRALAAMDAMGIDEGMSLAEGARRGIPPPRYSIYKYRRAKLLIDLGHDPTLPDPVRRQRLNDGLEQMWRLGFEISQLDAPEATRLLEQYGAKGPEDDFGIQHQLLRHGRHQDAMRLDSVWARAERRRAAFVEIRDKIVTRAPEEDVRPKFIRDQYSDMPYLVFFGFSGDYGVAFQLEQRQLLEDFLARTGVYRHQITITDAEGEWVAGAQPGPNDVYRESAPFKGLTHLRVRLLESALTNEAQLHSEQWLLPFGTMLVCLVLGIAALTVLERFTRRQYELLNRQRAFTTRVTHELRTPLAGIRVMAENLESGAFRTEEQREEMARRIVEEADRLKARVDEVLDVARERTIPSPVPVDPEEAVLDAIDQWGPRLEPAGVRLHADLHPTDEVVGDSGALRDAVGILLDNALKYRRSDRPDPQVWLTLVQEGRNVVIAVADNGLGVPRAMRKVIFDRFVRIEGPNRGPAGGHGLGLNQAREIVEAHRGTLVCSDGIDGGARFVIRIPVRRAG